MPAYRDSHSVDMITALGSVATSSAVSSVTAKLLDFFTSGSIEPGTRLPPERQLASSLGVGRSAVREALAALEILGVVDVRPGSGTYLRGSASELLPQSLSWGLLIGQRSTFELSEVRGALEIYTARLAAERMTDAQLGRLESALHRMRASLDDLAAFIEADLQFHQELAASTSNSVLLDLLQTIRSLLRVWVDRAVHVPEDARTALLEHTMVFDAIARHDADAAASAMALHMRTAGQRLLEADTRRSRE